jgi:hypothetical protein
VLKANNSFLRRQESLLTEWDCNMRSRDLYPADVLVSRKSLLQKQGNHREKAGFLNHPPTADSFETQPVKAGG